MRAAAFLATGVIAFSLAAQAAAAEKITFLFPAPDIFPAFAPFHIAKAKGYYEAEGLEVAFVAAKGGADVAKQVGAGNAELGDAIGDTPIVVRPNGVPVKGVALLGGKALHQIVARKDAGITTLADLKGKKVGVVAFQDTSYYNLLGVLASQGLTKDDVAAQAVGPAGVVQLMISGDLQAICGAPEWAVAIERAGVPVTINTIDAAFPAMAQAILASDKIIAERPTLVAGFVRATLKAVREVMADPAAATTEFIAAVPQHKGKEDEIGEVLRRYATGVYAVARPEDLGKFDEKRVASVQKFYLDKGIIATAVPVTDLFTNQFIGP
ncbi:MAG: nitrate transporter substrate-binding protein [Rhodospirillales bacterium]|jgi:NitT/TauT family transport system substrate-binding protein|nr:nitrate transporter substrate-binding protein [Rhodospirillales bacterium]